MRGSVREWGATRYGCTTCEMPFGMDLTISYSSQGYVVSFGALRVSTSITEEAAAKQYAQTVAKKFVDELAVAISEVKL